MLQGLVFLWQSISEYLDFKKDLELLVESLVVKINYWLYLESAFSLLNLILGSANLVLLSKFIASNAEIFQNFRFFRSAEISPNREVLDMARDRNVMGQVGELRDIDLLPLPPLEVDNNELIRPSLLIQNQPLNEVQEVGTPTSRTPVVRPYSDLNNSLLNSEYAVS